jgi:hypothetical protein
LNSEARGIVEAFIFSFFSFFSFISVGIIFNDILLSLLTPSIFGIILCFIEKEKPLRTSFYFMLINIGVVIFSIPFLGMISYPDVIFPLLVFYLIASPLLFSLPTMLGISKFVVGYLVYSTLVILKIVVEWDVLNLLNPTLYLVVMFGIIFNLCLTILYLLKKDKKHAL